MISLFADFFFLSFLAEALNGIQEDPSISIRISHEQIFQDPCCFSKSVLENDGSVKREGSFVLDIDSMEKLCDDLDFDDANFARESPDFLLFFKDFFYILTL